jgi:hypothetical protein
MAETAGFRRSLVAVLLLLQYLEVRAGLPEETKATLEMEMKATLEMKASLTERRTR